MTDNTVATQATFQIGEDYQFLAYSDAANMDDNDKLLPVGAMVRIHSHGDDGGMAVVLLDEQGQPTNIADTVFPEELVAPVVDAVPVEEPVVTGKKPVKGAKALSKEDKAAAKIEAARVAAEAKVQAESDQAADSTPVTSKKKGKSVAATTTVETTVEITTVPDTIRPAGGVNTVAALVYEDSEEVAALLQGQDALVAAKTLVDRAENTDFALGGVLAHIYDMGVYKRAGYEGKQGFTQYVRNELGIEYRKAMYLIGIYAKFRSLGLDSSRLQAIGWSKAKELIRYLTPDNAETLLEAAVQKSREELQQYIKTQFVDANPNEAREKIEKTILKFSLFADQGATVSRALDAACAQAGTDDINQSLEYICAEWLQSSEAVEVPLDDVLKHLEAKYGVTLAVVTPEVMQLSEAA